MEFSREECVMPNPGTIIELEKKFWQSIVDTDTDSALSLLCEPAVMVSSRGAMQFDHASYRRMAEQGPQVLKSFEFSDMKVVFPNDSTAVLTYRARQTMAPRGQEDGGTVQEVNDTSTWIKEGKGWKCVIHTESPAGKPSAH
jgi:ketosteroid isomerase-like protein